MKGCLDAPRPFARAGSRCTHKSPFQRCPRAHAVAGSTKESPPELTLVDKLALGLVDAVVGNDAIWSALSKAARARMLNPLEKKGLSLTDYTRRLEAGGVYDALKEIEDPNIVYPEYYLQKFHAYREGNLCWPAAFEAEYVWNVVAATATEQELHPRVIDDFNAVMADGVKAYVSRHELPAPRDILDVGCSSGHKTRGLRQSFPGASITGMDASPHFLAVALTEERLRGVSEEDRIRYTHAVFESSKVADASVDLLLFSFVFHECPVHAINAMLDRAARVVRPGGVVIITDMNPNSKQAAKRPPFVKALRKATEPWLDEYESMRFPAALQARAFKDVERFDVSFHHHAWIAHL